MYLNDLENVLIQKGTEVFDTGMLKLYLMLYADNIIFAESSEGLQKGLDIQSKDIIIRHFTRNLAKWIYTQFLLYTVLLLGKLFLTYN